LSYEVFEAVSNDFKGFLLIVTVAHYFLGWATGRAAEDDNTVISVIWVDLGAEL